MEAPSCSESERRGFCRATAPGGPTRVTRQGPAETRRAPCISAGRRAKEEFDQRRRPWRTRRNPIPVAPVSTIRAPSASSPVSGTWALAEVARAAPKPTPQPHALIRPQPIPGIRLAPRGYRSRHAGRNPRRSGREIDDARIGRPRCGRWGVGLSWASPFEAPDGSDPVDRRGQVRDNGEAAFPRFAASPQDTGPRRSDEFPPPPLYCVTTTLERLVLGMMGVLRRLPTALLRWRRRMRLRASRSLL